MLFRVVAGCAVLGLGLGACDDQVIQAVGPEQGCTADPAASLGFESRDNLAITADPARAPALEMWVSSQQRRCGAQSLAAQIALTWKTTDENEPKRLASFSYVLPAPVDLFDRMVGYWIYVEDLQITKTAQIGVISDRWHLVGIARELSPGWNRIDGKVDRMAVMLPVTALQLDFYVPNTDTSGMVGSWTGTIYLDDVFW